MTVQTFRKKPVEIQAMQLTRENGPAVWEWADSKPYYEPDGSGGQTISGLTIHTLEGRMKADFGDWIIRGVQGEFYPCKPDIFEATYEAVASGDAPASVHNSIGTGFPGAGVDLGESRTGGSLASGGAR